MADSVWFSKPRPGGGQHLGLSRESIVRKAVEVLDEHGLQKLSMRKLAAELGAAPMSLYWHVPTKDALMELCIDHIYAEMEPPDVDVSWDVMLRGLMHSLRQLALRHPWFVRVIGEYLSAGPNAVAMADGMLASMRTSGLSAVEASRASSAVSSYVIGFTLAEVNFGSRGMLEVQDAEVQKFVARYGEQHPDYVEVLTQRELYSLDTQFDFGLECVIDGIKARIGALRT